MSSPKSSYTSGESRMDKTELIDWIARLAWWRWTLGIPGAVLSLAALLIQFWHTRLSDQLNIIKSQESAKAMEELADRMKPRTLRRRPEITEAKDDGYAVTSGTSEGCSSIRRGSDGA